MSFLAKLEIDGTTYNVLECKYKFKQNYSETGKPMGLPQGGDIYLRIESKGSPEFFDWMIDPSHTKDGKIIFYRRDAMSKLQEIKFKKAFCVYFSEHFNAIDKEPLQIEMTISTHVFDLNGTVHEKRWKK
ncbi:type VI secretion system tube protein TssD [Riemerella anatipestifer]|nr:type VI secretion system tube protein TssD [Riemerella anatipestifer]MDY3324509.1 type VI secretion system tube protein TssD [Riemerella anatipestifer]MDY3353320.1 type VI secretion system tube protein TssD [Riemerella anatipestifer]